MQTSSPFINYFATETDKHFNGSSLANKSTSDILMHDFIPALLGLQWSVMYSTEKGIISHNVPGLSPLRTALPLLKECI